MTYLWLALAFIAAAVVAGVIFARAGARPGVKPGDTASIGKPLASRSPPWLCSRRCSTPS
jgi:hypothetical protein